MSWRRALLPATALPVIALLAYGLTRSPNIIDSPLPGRAAFDFTSTTLDGDTLSLSDLKGKVVVLNFWASWCVACIDEHPVLAAAERLYASRGFQVLGVVYQDSPENARRWMARMGGGWPSIMDGESRIAIEYGVYGVPETFFIGRDGRIAYKQIGPVNWPLLQQWVDRLLAQSPNDDLALDEAPAGGLPAGTSEGHVQGGPGGVTKKETER